MDGSKKVTDHAGPLPGGGLEGRSITPPPPPPLRALGGAEKRAEAPHSGAPQLTRSPGPVSPCYRWGNRSRAGTFRKPPGFACLHSFAHARRAHRGPRLPKCKRRGGGARPGRGSALDAGPARSGVSVRTHTPACVDPRKWSRIPTPVPHYAHITPGAPHFCLTPHSQQGLPPSLAKAPVPHRCPEAPDPPPPCGRLHGCPGEPEASRFLRAPQVPRAELSRGARICTHPEPRLSRRPARTYWSWPLTPTPRRP